MGKRRNAEPGLPLPIAEGVHLCIPPNVYFEAQAIGSSDLKTLYWQPESWWLQSWANLRRRGKFKGTARKSHFELGDALHTLVLEGEDVFSRRYVLEPDEEDGKWIRTPQDAKRVLQDKGVDTAGVYGPDLERLARRHGLANHYWKIAAAEFDRAQKAGRPSLTEDQAARVRFTAHLITSHPELGPALCGPGGLSEVAVFWHRPEDPDTLMRAKFDRLRPGRMLDLKSLSNWRGKDRDGAIRDTIEQAPPDIMSDVLEAGIMLTGGVARLHGIGPALSERLGLAVHIAEEPDHVVARGLTAVLKNHADFKHIYVDAD